MLSAACLECSKILNFVQEGTSSILRSYETVKMASNLRALRLICSRPRLARKLQAHSIANVAVRGDSKVVENTTKPDVAFPKHFINRNPRSLELLGVAPKPKGFETSRRRVDYYYRYLDRSRFLCDMSC